MSTPLAAAWERLGEPPPEALADARLQLHHAVQLLAAFGDALVPPRPDYSHSAATWDPRLRALVSEATGDDDAGPRLRVALYPARLAIGLLAGPAGELGSGAELPLRGRSRDDASAWLSATLEAAAGEPGSALGTALAATLGEAKPDIPHHPVADGAPFGADIGALAELERWYHDAHLLLEEVRAAAAAEGLAASPVRCWPHHFDIATLITLEPDADPEEARSIGVGMAPGDDSYPEPYFYITPWPYPDPLPPEGLPALPAPARWHTEGWVGSVLCAADFLAAADLPAANQALLAARYARASVAACRALLGG